MKQKNKSKPNRKSLKRLKVNHCLETNRWLITSKEEVQAWTHDELTALTLAIALESEDKE